jgi:hypothetical protein
MMGMGVDETAGASARAVPGGNHTKEHGGEGRKKGVGFARYLSDQIAVVSRELTSTWPL